MRSVAVATSLLLVVGCATELPSGNIFIVRGVVAGTVTAAGAPVTVVTVIATAQYPSSGPPLVITDSTRPDNAGHYLVSLAVQNVPDARAPLDVKFRPDAGSGLPTRISHARRARGPHGPGAARGGPTHHRARRSRGHGLTAPVPR